MATKEQVIELIRKQEKKFVVVGFLANRDLQLSVLEEVLKEIPEPRHEGIGWNNLYALKVLQEVIEARAKYGEQTAISWKDLCNAYETAGHNINNLL